MDETSMTSGWLAGRRIAGQRTKQKTLIGYSYNGTVLPALPERDKETYPYAFIVTQLYTEGYTQYNLYFAKTVDDIDSECLCYTTYNGPFLVYRYRTDSNNFAFSIDIESKPGIVYGGAHIWNNPDLIDNKGNFFAASDPIPVYA